MSVIYLYLIADIMMTVPRSQTCLPINFTSHNRDNTNTHTLCLFTRTVLTKEVKRKKKNITYATTVMNKKKQRQGA